MNSWHAIAAGLVILGGATSAASAGGDIAIATPPPGFTNTYLVDVGPNRILGIDGTLHYEWWWNMPLWDDFGFTGEFLPVAEDSWTGAGCVGEWSCSASTSTHGQTVTTAFGLTKWGDWGKYLVRVSNRVTQPDFNLCADAGDSLHPCAMIWDQPQFGVYVEDPRALNGVKVTLLSSTAVPEPATWAMVIIGFGLAGSALRRRRSGYSANSPRMTTS